eukprot:252712_1
MQNLSSFQICMGTVGTLCSLSILTVIIYDVVAKYRYYKNKTTQNVTSKEDKILLCLIYLCSISFFANCIVFTMPLLNSNLNDTFCTLIVNLGGIAYHCSRCSMYTIFVRRINISFKESKFELKKIHLNILYIIIWLYFIPYVFYIDWMYCYGVHINHMKLCTFTYNLFAFSGAYIMDNLLSWYCLYKFIYPLRQLSKDSFNNDNEANLRIKKHLYNVMIKYAILGCTAILSTILMLTFAVIFEWGAYLLFIDDLTNVICVLLIHPAHKKLYYTWYLCKYCRKYCDGLCGQFGAHSDIQLMLQTTHSTTSNHSTATATDQSTATNEQSIPTTI